MSDSCMRGSGLVWLILIIIVIVIIILLVFWAWPWGSCSGCNTNPNQPEVFRVTVAKKNKTHPSFNKGSDWGFVINDVQGKSLILKVGKQYRFVVSCEEHPFYLSVHEKGGKDSEATSSDSNYVKQGGLPGQIDITGTPITTGSFNINVYKDMPRLMYYACTTGEYMGGSIIIEE